MAEIVQQMFLRSVGSVGGGANAVVLERISFLEGRPNHLAINCLILYTVASTAPSEFWATNATTCGNTYIVTIDRANVAG
jgi:hypothetical protein